MLESPATAQGMETRCRFEAYGARVEQWFEKSRKGLGEADCAAAGKPAEDGEGSAITQRPDSADDVEPWKFVIVDVFVDFCNPCDAHRLLRSLFGACACRPRQAEHRRQPIMHLRSEEHTSELQSLMRISYA